MNHPSDPLTFDLATSRVDGVPLTTSEVPRYVARHPDLVLRLGGASDLDVREVGDGNLNLIFIVRPRDGRTGLVLKQALPYVRLVGESWPLTVERAAQEALAYRTYGGFARDLIPDFFGYDTEKHILAMEDLSGLLVWRTALNDGEIFPSAAADVGRFVARVAFRTSDFGLDPAARKLLAAQATNPELCRITEDLVFLQPYIDHPNNRFEPELAGRVRTLREDTLLRTEVAELKHVFMTHAEALIHGDLHTGSVMVSVDRTAIFDPEFCFFGPVGFDLGALWANAVIAAARADRLGRPRSFKVHVAEILSRSWLSFQEELTDLWSERIDGSFDGPFLNRYLTSVWTDALGFAGAKAIRRIVGIAHVSDIESLPDDVRSSAADAVLRVGRRLIMDRHTLRDPVAAWRLIDAEIRA